MMIRATLLHSRRRRWRMATLAAIGMAATISVGTALAWAPPSLTALCAPDANHYSWHINLSQEQNYKIQFSWSSNFSNAWVVDFGSKGGHDFDTDRGGSTLYARWKDDIYSKTSAAANDELCEPEESPTPSSSPSEEPTATPTPTPEPTPVVTPTPEQSEAASTPTPTPEQSVAGGTGTPAPSLPDSAMTDTAGSNPLPAVAFGLVLLASLATLAKVNVMRTVRNRD